MTKDELIAYAREQYGTEPEYLWESAPNTFVLRHRGNRKWYAVVMDVRRDRLGLPGGEIVYIMDVKCGPLLGGSYLGKRGVVPAYHMNKTHWLGVLLGSDRSGAASEAKRERTADAPARDAREPELKAQDDWLRPTADGSAADEIVTELLDLSYSQTQTKKKR